MPQSLVCILRYLRKHMVGNGDISSTRPLGRWGATKKRSEDFLEIKYRWKQARFLRQQQALSARQDSRTSG